MISNTLELCPASSILRKLYYDRCRVGISCFPRVVVGNPDSWDLTISFSSKDSYQRCTWSPCGRFVAARTTSNVEIRNQLTFQLLAVLQSPITPSLLEGPPAYSPDGRSLACGFSNGIVIWDIQTGGVARSINCCNNILFLVWSMDGKTIASAPYYCDGFSSVNTYDVAPGAPLFEGKFEQEWVFQLWAWEKTFRFISQQWFFASEPALSISEIGPSRIKIESLPVVCPPSSFTADFAPSTCRLSISSPNTLRILDARNLQSLLHETNEKTSPYFSSDGNLFAAGHKNGFRVWKYASDRYTLLVEFPLPHIPYLSPTGLAFEFSPTSTSILLWYRNFLQVWRLHAPPTTPKTCHRHAALSRSGRYIATVRQSQSTVIIINLHSKTPLQFIDTDGEIEGLAITGNVLLVVISEKVVGWLLTEEGKVAGVVDSRRANHGDSIWTVTSPPQYPKSLCFRVSGQLGVIGAENFYPFSYHTGTGGAPDRVHTPQQFRSPWVPFYKPSNYNEYHYLRNPDIPQSDAPLEDSWLVSRTTTGKPGWVVDPEGRHRFWVPVEWRAPWDRNNCHHDILTLFIKIGDQPVMIMF